MASVAATWALALAVLLGAPLSGGWLIVGVVALQAVIAWGVVDQGSGVFARPVLAVATPRAELALTFDDGPHPSHTRAVMDALEARGHRGTFFVIGRRAAEHPELLSEMVARGHELANHSQHHSYVTNLVPPRRLARELEATSALLCAASGAPPRWFRPPVGLLSPRIAAAVRLAGLDLVAWTATARDGTARRTVEEAAERLRGALRPGAILVLHDAALHGERTPIAPAVLEVLLAELDARGLRSVTLSQLCVEDG